MSILSFKNVHVSQDGVPTLQDVSLELNQGDFVYLIGKSGSGKSTFFKSIFAELPIDSGLASVAGYSLNDIKSNEIPFLRRKLGFVFQDFQLLTDRNVEMNLSVDKHRHVNVETNRAKSCTGRVSCYGSRMDSDPILIVQNSIVFIEIIIFFKNISK